MSKQQNEEVVENQPQEVVESTENERSEAAATEPSTTEAQVEADDGLEVLRKRIQELEAENSKLKDQYLRKSADFDNFRKRMFREKEESVKYANTNLLSDIINIIDDFERAIKSSQESKDFDMFHSGIELIEKQFTGMLERNWGLKRFESEGEPFDPQKHEAINMEEREGLQDQTVLEDYQKGYMLHDRVLRHSKVKVGVPKVAPSGNSDDNDQNQNKE
ncbi:nucleotide exchange factor GrpE [Marispirochaeta aestuarii]|uniref:Protein GrpE n=1 Tax=Marispirochaeta aestuarii TaxID=1963862 RepID=A0A1Y1S2P4_9SPIO|nr:nucleotide exchange factor GrpE [Marispirochaeta aestuarii]ORC38250.1 nucleotide exchange factor GrpE [Marispirochaeta aestuarii]